MTDAEKVAAVTAKLVGTFRVMRPRRWIDKGEQWLEVMETTPPGAVNGFDEYTCRGVHLTAHESGWIEGILYVGEEPVELKIRPLREL